MACTLVKTLRWVALDASYFMHVSAFLSGPANPSFECVLKSLWESLERWLIPGLGKAKYKMQPEHILLCQRVRKCFEEKKKKDGGGAHLGYENQLEAISTGQIWDNLITKIIKFSNEL